MGQTSTINITLKPGSVHEEVTITADAVMIDQVSAQLGYVTGTTQILELPTGRSPYSLLTLSPGVIATGNTGTGPIVSGGRSNTSAILLDGQDTRNNSTLDNAYTPPQETVGEVRFITNNFSAEYGRSAGGVLVAAGKSGTNQLHGSAYDYFRNDKLNANTWANNTNNLLRGRQRRNDYGFTLSGPVYIPKVYDGRNRTFFFFNWEETNDHGVSSPTAMVPTALQKSGDFSQTFTNTGALIRIYDPATTMPDPARPGSYIRTPFPNNVIPPNRIDPIMRKVTGYYPDPTLPVSPTLQNNWSQNFANIAKTPRWYTRADQNFGTRNRLFFRFGYQTSPRTSPYSNIAFPGEGTNGGGNQESISYSYALSDTHTFTPNLVGEFRAGYTRSIIKLTPLSVGFDITSLGLPQYLKAASTDAIFPRFNIDGLTAVGPDRASHNVDAESTPEFQAHFTWLKGAHAVKTGVDTLFGAFNTFRPDYPSGTFSFTKVYTQGPDPTVASATTGYGLAGALLGVPDGGSFTVGPSLALLQPSYNWYLNDDWRITRNLSLSLRSLRISDPVQGALQSTLLFRPRLNRTRHWRERRAAHNYGRPSLSKQSESELGAARRIGVDLPSGYGVPCRLRLVLCSGQRWRRIQPWRSRQWFVRLHEYLLWAAAGSSQHTGVRSVAHQSLRYRSVALPQLSGRERYQCNLPGLADAEEPDVER